MVKNTRGIEEEGFIKYLGHSPHVHGYVVAEGDAAPPSRRHRARPPRLALTLRPPYAPRTKLAALLTLRSPTQALPCYYTHCSTVSGIRKALFMVGIHIHLLGVGEPPGFELLFPLIKTELLWFEFLSINSSFVCVNAETV